MQIGQGRRCAARTGLAIFAAACILGTAMGAQARTEQLRWSHGNPTEIAGFNVHVGISSGAYSVRVDAGKPTIRNGAYVFNLDVLDGADVYIAISARGKNGLTSALSNERLRPAPEAQPQPATLGTPGQPVVVSQ
ncbi:MAG: hypothetical protein GY723_17470 [bacterium]|nr:hypothetical protein [bacterium]MCP5068601.1 hypothetical protein [bacterium]